MSRPLAALAALFAIAIGIAAALLYWSDRQRLQEIAENAATSAADRELSATDAETEADDEADSLRRRNAERNGASAAGRRSRRRT
jgi:hypothetical protein